MRVLALLLLIPLSTLADDSAYEKARDKLFWPKLYNSDFTTLYCSKEGSSRKGFSVEHVYASDWIAESMGCDNRKECKKEKYRQASSDLHNLWPALQRYNSSRSDLKFGEIPGEKQRFPEDECDFERTSGKDAIVEPRDEVKGQIARSFLYMVHWYDLPHQDLLPLMIKWHKENPVTDEEKRRNRLIESIQERSNPFIEM